MTASSRTPFNSRPHKEVDYDLLFLVKGTPTFQFTTSQGGRLRLKLSFLLAAKLSIHDLTRRSTAWGYHGKARGVLSIHDLTRRSTNTKQELSDGEALSIHDLTRRSTILARCVMVNLPFQFTTSQGGRLDLTSLNRCGSNLSIHDLTRRSTQSIGITPFKIISFNSRPHKEVDGRRQNGEEKTCRLSIHDLTRRSTRWDPGY